MHGNYPNKVQSCSSTSSGIQLHYQITLKKYIYNWDVELVNRRFKRKYDLMLMVLIISNHIEEYIVKYWRVISKLCDKIKSRKSSSPLFVLYKPILCLYKPILYTIDSRSHSWVVSDTDELFKERINES
jgi:hypothetical protein